VGSHALGAHQHTFYSQLKRILSRNLDQSMLIKLHIFEREKKKKKRKNHLSDWGSASEPLFASGGWGLRFQTPTLLLPPTITILSSSLLSLNAFYYPKKEQNYYSKCSAFAFSTFCTYFFLQIM